MREIMNKYNFIQDYGTSMRVNESLNLSIRLLIVHLIKAIKLIPLGCFAINCLQFPLSLIIIRNCVWCVRACASFSVYVYVIETNKFSKSKIEKRK